MSIEEQPVQEAKFSSDELPAPVATQELTEPSPWSPAAVRLLQGVVYHDEHPSVWELILANISPLSEYFGKVGLQLVIDETDAMAYLRQPNEDELPDSHQAVPRLFRRSTLGYESTLLCVLLRDELRQFEEEDVQNERCVVAQLDILNAWKEFFPNERDEVKLNRNLQSSLRRLEELKFVRQFEKDPPSWEIRRIIKAKLPLHELEQLRTSLLQAAAEQNDSLGDDTPLFDAATDA